MNLDYNKKVFFIDDGVFCICYGDHAVCVWRMKQESHDKICMRRSVRDLASVTL